VLGGRALVGASGVLAPEVAGASPGASSSSAKGLDVLPFPGTPDAAPGTNIDFPAASRAQVASVTAVGSRSGLHTGNLCAQPAGHGTAFSPDGPFAPGERVSVTATLRSAAAATASGAPGSEQISFSFSVARPATFMTSAGTVTAGHDGLRWVGRRTAASSSRTHSFVTEPGFHVPWVHMSGRATDAAAGDTFLDATRSGQNAAYILNPQGALIWYQPAPSQGKPLNVHDVRVQRYNGEPVLTYWQGHSVDPPGGGRGVDRILNNNYQTIHTVTAGNGYQSQGADYHDFVLGHEGSEATAFIEVWKPVQANLTSIGGPSSGPTFDWIIQEIDIATGKVVWEWHSLGHVPIASSYSRHASAVPYDYFHMNSIQQLPDGNILISSRNAWAVYLINKKTGKIIWRLGGKHSSFKMGPHTNFEWQHDATLHNNGLLTLFDDGAAPREEHQSRALELHISTATHRAALIHAFKHKPATLATAEGSAELLANRNLFIGWGNMPYFSEYTRSGRQVLGGSFHSLVSSYRAYRFHWVGSPLRPPAIVVRRSKTAGRDVVYASWNGSTEVRTWQVLASQSRSGPFAKLGPPAPWSSFETTIQRPTAAYFEVQALGKAGRLLPNGTSRVVSAP
jgi:outer membrane protein assembly factor BamB